MQPMATTTPNAVRANIADGEEGYRFHLRKRGIEDINMQLEKTVSVNTSGVSLFPDQKNLPMNNEEICEIYNSLSLRIVSILNSLGLPSDKAQTSSRWGGVMNWKRRLV